MRTWKRAGIRRRCGHCGQPIAPDDAMLVIRLRGYGTSRPEAVTLPIEKIRCVMCEGPAPADLPAFTPPAPAAPLAMVRTGPGMLPLDWKQVAAGREPGEDDQ